MSISEIRIKDKTGTLIGKLQGKCGISIGDADPGDMEISKVEAVAPTMELSSPGYMDIYEQAYSLLVEDITGSGVLRTINNVSPTDDGIFFLNGSRCISWDEKLGSDLAYRANDNRVVITDLCSACTSCGPVVALRRRLERLKMTLNTIKDCNLYDSSDAVARLQYLFSKRMPATPTCNDTNTDIEDRLMDMAERSPILLSQYATVMHMWNYLVARVNSNVEISNSPEDKAGFYIQTKFARPTCDGGTDVSCVIAVELVSGQSQLSVFVPQPVITFHPYSTDGGGPITGTVTMSSPTNGTVTIARQPGTSAGTRVGTYTVRVKWLPFYKVIQKKPDGMFIDVMEYDTDIKPPFIEPTEDGELVHYNDISMTQQLDVVQNPTLEDYTKYRNYLSITPTTTNRWQITVTWTLSGTINSTQVDTYYFETPGVRIPVDANIYRNTTLKNRITTV